MNDTQVLITKLERLSHPKQVHKNFPAYIKKIHFPFFKNLQKDSEITFDYPLTVFIGQNGCGKSSALQALFGCPDGNSIGKYWFNTATDPIPESKNDISPSFWFEYFNESANQDVQILKYRISFDKRDRVNPDYWEPARPLSKYGMKAFSKENSSSRLKTRWEGLEKKVVYLDFRAELSAFDKYFYFADNPKSKTIKSKQDYIRTHSFRLQQIFNQEVKIHYRKIRNGQGKKHPLNFELISLPKPELDAICQILGKNYSAAKLVQHSFYKQEGFSIRFESKRPDTSELNYTEAFAGSGEMSVVTLVHQVYNASRNSLILLDEPEVSLHPGAQKRILKFLLNQINEKKHQVIICTHSPSLIEDLPESAIKLFSPTPDGYFKIFPKIHPAMAFSYIGQTITDKVKIIVEDEAAKQLVEKVISLEDHWADVFEVDFHLGGAQDLFKEALAFSRVNEKKRFFILDGDQKWNNIKKDDEIGNAEIDGLIFTLTKIDKKEFQWVADGGVDKEEQLLSEKRKYLQYLKDYFRFLPKNTPEEILLRISIISDKPKLQGVDAKEVIEKWTLAAVDNPKASDISSSRKRLLKQIDLNHDDVRTIQSDIHSLLSHK